MGKKRLLLLIVLGLGLLAGFSMLAYTRTTLESLPRAPRPGEVHLRTNVQRPSPVGIQMISNATGLTRMVYFIEVLDEKGIHLPHDPESFSIAKSALTQGDMQAHARLADLKITEDGHFVPVRSYTYILLPEEAIIAIDGMDAKRSIDPQTILALAQSGEALEPHLTANTYDPTNGAESGGDLIARVRFKESPPGGQAAALRQKYLGRPDSKPQN